MWVPSIMLRKMRRQPILISIVLLNLLVFSLYFTLFSNYGSFTSSILSQSQQPLQGHITNYSDETNKNLNKPSMSSLLDKLAVIKEDTIDKVVNTLYKKLFHTELKNSDWRFADHYINSEIDLDIGYVFNYVNKRKEQHVHDPRITMAVYLNHLNDLYDDKESQELPFSWEDWVDLTYLNPFLNSPNSSCSTFLHSYEIEADYVPQFHQDNKSTDFFDQTFCLDNDDYFEKYPELAKFRNKNLLPNFNFAQHIREKTNFVGQLFNAKSYLLSFAEPPSLIYFMGDNGTYHKVKPYQSSSMMENGLFDTFVGKSDFQGFKPYHELLNLNKNFEHKSQNDFKSRMLDSNSYELSISEDRFDLNPKDLFHHLYAKKESSLEPNEKAFLESMEFSQNTKPDDVQKYFSEVNVKWYAEYNGHKIRENGGHYDFRFFSGFLSEMPESDHTTKHSPLYDASIKRTQKTIDNEINRQTIILSHMVHTLFTLTFHDGLFIFPAHGSLLAWYFNSLSFPYDEDEDVQMPIADLAEFCLKYNNSLVVENPKYGAGKYYVDCGSSLTHRIRGLGNNNIDARIIDVDSGMYVDITGLAVSSERLHEDNLRKFQGWLTEEQIKEYPLSNKNNDDDEETKKEATPDEIIAIHKADKVYNCRNRHFYTWDQVSPVRLTLFEGAPTFVVASNKSLVAVLDDEYGEKSHKNPDFKDWFFIQEIRMWVRKDEINHACDAYKAKKKIDKNFEHVTDCLHADPMVLSEIIKNSVYDITLKKALANKDNTRPKFNILGELYRDNNLTSAHTREMNHYHSGWEWKTPKLNDQTNLPTEWEELAKWMLEDHPPPRTPLLDYLIAVEKEDIGKTINF